MKRKVNLIFQLSLFCISLSGIAFKLSLSRNLSGALMQLSYYTLQTNLIVAIVALLNAVFSVKTAKSQITAGLLRIITGGSVLWITVTMTICHLLLSDHYRPRGQALFANNLLHYVIPLLAIIFWLIFEEGKSYRFFYPLLWAVYPLSYAVVSVIRGAITGFFPYWFLNPAAAYPNGIGSYLNLFIFTLVVGLIFIATEYLMVFLNHLHLSGGRFANLFKNNNQI